MNIFICPKFAVRRFPTRLLVPLCFLMFSAAAFAGNQLVRINEIMAGLNGDSAIQFVELFVPDESQKQWGPQSSELVGRVMLVFFDGGGNQAGRYVFPSDPAPGALSVLVATQEFADLTGITPDFIMPKGVMPIAGKVSFRNNPDAGAAASSINLCLSYGGSAFTGNTEGAGPANAAKLSILDSQSLRRIQNFGAASFGSSGQLNADFALGTPTPSSTRASGNATSIEHNLLGEAVLPVADTQPNQGKNLFLRETFLGNSRTCATCHSATDQFSLPPAKVASLPNSDPLFINENNVNTLVVNSAGSVLPTAGSGSTQPSDFVLNGIITGNLGGSAKVLSGTGNTYLIIGGAGLNIAGNVLSDAKGDRGTLGSFTPGNLNGPTPSNTDPNGLENSSLLRGARALILENINGFSQNGFMRGSPSLINVKFTAPYGLSGEFPDLQSFAANAVKQHFTRNLNRVVGTDFRVPTPEELDALAAFQNSLVSPADENFDETHQFDRFLTTASQIRGRDGFFGPNKCSTCHGGKALSTSNGQFGTTLGANESFNTGVVNLLGGVPTEQDVGQPANSRKFNVPALFGVKNTGPFFHDGSAATLLDAIVFYDSGAFVASPAFAQVGFISVSNATDIRDFLEAVVGQTNALPTITGVAVGQSINDNAVIMPFSGVTIADADVPAQTLLVMVKMDNAAKGRFSALNGFNDLGDGIASFSATAAAATTAIRGLEFDPTDDRVSAGATETTTFVITINDSADAAVVNSTTTVISTAVNGAAGISRIGTQFIVIDTATAAIPFTLSGLDPASSSFALAGSSSNQGLVPNANIVFGGSGKNRTVTLTPVASQIGTTTITVSASDGSRSASTTFLLIVGQSAQQSDVIPNQFTNSEGDANSGSLSGNLRLQQIYSANHFPAGSLLITELRFRRDLSQGPFSTVIPSIQFILSTTPTAPDALSTDFASNFGSDATVVFSGPLALSSSAAAPPGGPIPFDIVVPLATPFFYDSTTGNLMVDIQNPSGVTVALVDASSSFSDGASRALGSAANSTTAFSVNTGADIIQLTYLRISGAPTLSDIPTQSIIAGSSSGAIPFTVSDPDTSIASLSLTGTSSNPSLVPDANIVFGGAGANRTVTVTPAPGQAGQAVITVSVSDGSFTTHDTFVANITEFAGSTTVVPNQFSTSEGDSFSGTLTGNVRLQDVYGAVHFPLGILRITEIRFRRDANQGPISLIVPSAQFNLSTTTTAPDNLNGNFASNVGPDDTIVYSGSLSISSPPSALAGSLSSTVPLVQLATSLTNFNLVGSPVDGTNSSSKELSPTASSTNFPSGLLLPGNTNALDAPVTAPFSSVNTSLTSAAANPFDIVVPLTTPFNYDSTAGNLLLEVRDFSGVSAGLFDAAGSPTDSASRAFATGVSSPAATAMDTVAEIVEFLFIMINSAPTISGISDQITQHDIPTGAIAFTVADAETSAVNLTLTGSSSNPSLVPNGNIVFGGSGANRTVSLTPAPGQTGTTVLTITVQDGTLSASDTFVLVVGPLPPTISDIPDQTILLSATAPAIAFTVGDLDTALNNLTLSATSSNPSLLPAGNIAFSGVGAARTLTLTPMGPNEGQATVTVTVSDGALTANDTFVVTVERVLVLPPGNDSTPGNAASGTLIAPIRLQNLYHASLFPASPILIKRLSFRANEGGTPPISSQIPRLQIRLSSTPAAPDAMSTSFTANAGADNTLVFDGPLSINSAGANGPNAGPFDINIPLTTPFVYNPFAGNLLIDVQNFSSGPSFFVDSAASGSDLSSRVWNTSPTTGQNVDSVADVIKLEYDFASGPFAPVLSAIPDQTWAVGTTAQTLNFVVSDFDTALNNLALSVTSSNPALIPGSNLVLGGGGPNRTLTLTPIVAAQGQTTITITASDGALSVTKAFVVTISNKLVVPAGLGFIEGNSASGTLIAPIRLQNLYHASLFPPVPIRITHVSFRAEQGTGPFASQIPSLQINMSTTTTAPDGLGTSFAANHGPNNTQVFNGPLAINTAGALAGPGAFDITVPLSTPFLYVPSSGNLLVDIQNFSSGPSFFVDTAFNPNDLSSRVWNTTAASGQFVDTHADVIQFTYQPGNLSPTISSLPDRIMVEDVANSIKFSVGDAETPLSLLTLAGISSNHSLVPDANLAFAGSGANRSVMITPSPNRSGTTIITLSVADSDGATASRSFLLTVLADADGDQVPDDFEVANGMDRLNPADAAQDLDGDGFSNLEEFLLGTDPRAASVGFEISNTQPNGTDLEITFNSVAGKTYRFERSNISPAGPWIAISDVVGNGGTLQLTDVDGAAQAKRFYHLVLLP